MLLFLSYADEDSGVAGEVERWFTEHYREHHVDICFRLCKHDGHTQAAGGPDDALSRADAFLVLMSPSYLDSASCRREREVALQRDRLQVAAGGPPFIYVLRVRETHYDDAGELRAWVWLVLPAESGIGSALTNLCERLSFLSGNATPAVTSGPRESPRFHDRDPELKQVVDDLTSPEGVHFWSVIALPQLGKSWFLNQVNADLRIRAPADRWTVKLVDVRDKPPEVRRSAEALLGMLLGTPAPARRDQRSLRALAVSVSNANKFHLCLLDSAELLDAETVKALRECLSQVRQMLTQPPKPDVRLALIVASRRERWNGLGHRPHLTLQPLPLTEFDARVVEAVLREMSARMGYDVSDARVQSQVQSHAKEMYLLSEGLPALLNRYLSWIRAESFTGLNLQQNLQFNELTRPYIEQELLSASSLFGRGAAPTDDQHRCVTRALQLLAPYRFFTQAHLSPHAKESGALRPFMQVLGWEFHNLWNEVTNTDLLDRPQPQPWEVIHAPIRRLLCRFWYPLDAHLEYAHRTARQFMLDWGSKQSGGERSRALVECLWHESQVLTLNRDVNAAEKLTAFARQMSQVLSASSGSWSPNELQNHAAYLIGQDTEVGDAARSLGFSVDRLTSAVLMPGSESS